MWTKFSLTAALVLTACSAPSLDTFRNTAPAFDPVLFFTGHLRSWGVLENRQGGPTSIVTTQCQGTAEVTSAGPGIHMMQRLTIGQTRQTRDWHLHRTETGRYEATANDIIGMAVGDAEGRAFHWRFTLATQPGDSLKNVTMDQWMYAMEDGSMINRTIVSKLGLVLAEVTEQFVHTSTTPE